GSGYGLGQRYRDGLLKLLALEVVGTARPLRPRSLLGIDAELAAEDVVLVERLAEALQESLVRLVQSRRPDWGFPLLVGMARLIALDETLRTRRWIVLDASSAGATVIARSRFLGHTAFKEALRERVASDFDSTRTWLRAGSVATGFPEVEFVEFE